MIFPKKLNESNSTINNGWISVNDMLPNRCDFNDYLITDGKHYFVAKYRHDLKIWDGGKHYFVDKHRYDLKISDDHRYNITITHWRPLPKLPKEEDFI